MSKLLLALPLLGPLGAPLMAASAVTVLLCGVSERISRHKKAEELLRLLREEGREVNPNKKGWEHTLRLLYDDGVVGDLFPEGLWLSYFEAEALDKEPSLEEKALILRRVLRLQKVRALTRT